MYNRIIETTNSPVSNCTGIIYFPNYKYTLSIYEDFITIINGIRHDCKTGQLRFYLGDYDITDYSTYRIPILRYFETLMSFPNITSIFIGYR
jgi:hypothetical protein